jgi:flagellar hook-associated protein 2
MLTAAGVGSGLDIEGIISQLMALERRPLNVLEDRKDEYGTELSAVGRLKSALATFQSAMVDLKSTDAFQVYAASSDDEEVFTAIASSRASVGTFDIEIVNLAEADKQGSKSIADVDTTPLGETGDQISIAIGSGSFTIDAGGLTLAEIRDAINDAMDNVGVSAGIISEDASNNYLVLTSNETGTANAITLSVTGQLENALNMTSVQTAEDAEVRVDSKYTVVRSSNTITDAIDGLTLQLKKESNDAVGLRIERDVASVTESVQSFSDAFNELRATINGLRSGELQADSTLRTIESGMLNILNVPPPGLAGRYTVLSQVGLTIQKDGTMALNSAKLEEALNSDFSSLAQVFANEEEGYVLRLESLVTGFLNADGILDNRIDGINNRISRADDQIANMEYRLGRIEERFRERFSALDALVGQLTATNNFLVQQLAGL